MAQKSTEPWGTKKLSQVLEFTGSKGLSLTFKLLKLLVRFTHNVVSLIVHKTGVLLLGSIIQLYKKRIIT